MSRDICYAVNKKRTTGEHGFILSMHEEYFPSYRLCVQAPEKASICRTFPVRQSGRFSPRWGGYVSWERNYPQQGNGPYRVTWLQGGQRLGPALTFYRRLPSYCSASGDLCYNIALSGPYSLKLTLAARYFSRYRLCVRPLGKARICKSFPVTKTRGRWGGKEYWSHHFPEAPGRYRVTWLQGTTRLGPPLTFTRPIMR